MIRSLIGISRDTYNTFPLFVRNSKIMEELGEFSEALMHKLGYLPHKTMKEPLMGEAADVIICVLDTLSAAYPELTEDELYNELQEQFVKKSEKWKTVMKQRHDLGIK